ncbi:hypothetical protein MKX08_007573 [Trichoderma sp. CBMAI-0020]|nr:hypothetical protein MKX08_007573 [Trichoderma sp. CBMAI-0020]
MVYNKSLNTAPSSSANIEGVNRHDNEGSIKYYAGVLIVGQMPYQFQSAGYYGWATPKGQDALKSIFIFAKLGGIFFTLELAEISIICGGVGYNSNARVSTAEEVDQFTVI